MMNLDLILFLMSTYQGISSASLLVVSNKGYEQLLSPLTELTPAPTCLDLCLKVQAETVP